MRINEHSGEISGHVQGWTCADVLFELHDGPPHELPRHAHSAWQIGTTTREPGHYLVDGRAVDAPPGSMLVFAPGQVHSAPRGVRSASVHSRIMFVAPARLRDVAATLTGRDSAQPSFASPVVRDRAFIQRFCDLHRMVLQEEGGSLLEKESCLVEVLSALVEGFGQVAAAAPRGLGQAKTRTVREYVEDNYSESISLSQLAEMVHVSPCHLNRTFAQEVGMPPHAFQTQVRVDRAKPLLLQGVPVAEVALRTGFFDQSHFTRHFRRIVGVPPRSYVHVAA